jgi:hypothetical protein
MSPVGRRLQLYQTAWNKLSNEDWIRNTISKGYVIPFDTLPPTHPHPQGQHQPKISKETTAIEQEIMALLSKKAIEEATEEGFSSRIFTIPKKTGDLRPVLNLRPLNQYITPPHFKMESIKMVCNIINRKDYLTSIDLQDAFLHILIHPTSRKYLQFHWKGKQFQFRVLPFGLSLAPYVFTKILKPILKWARRKGIRISAYLDDLLIVA